MTEEEKQPISEEKPLTADEKVAIYEQTIKELNFFSSPVSFNAELFKGFRILLTAINEMSEKITAIEAKLNEKKV